MRNRLGRVKTGCAIVALVIAAAATMVLADPPDNLFRGGTQDGYDQISVTNTNFPPEPPNGTVICIK